MIAYWGFRSGAGTRPLNRLAGVAAVTLMISQGIPSLADRLAPHADDLTALAARLSKSKDVAWPVQLGGVTLDHGWKSPEGEEFLKIGDGVLTEYRLVHSPRRVDYFESHSHVCGDWWLVVAPD